MICLSTIWLISFCDRSSGNRDCQNGIRIRIHFLNHRRERIQRELVDDRSHFVPHVLHCGLDVSLEDELIMTMELPLLGSRAQFVDPGDGVYDFLDRFGNLVSISSALAPGKLVRTKTIGMSVLGIRSRPSWL